MFTINNVKPSYAPDDGAGQGESSDTVEQVEKEKVDIKRDVDQPEKDMYPEQNGEKQGETTDNTDTQSINGKPKNKEREVTDDKPDDEEEEKKANGKVDFDAVPEDGKYILKMPEGVEIDQELLDTMAPLWKEKGLTHKDAQTLSDAYLERRMKEVKDANESWEETVAKWSNDAKVDKEIGGEKFQANLTVAKNALEKFGTPELNTALDNSGMGNHPEIIRLLVNVGNRIMDDDIPGANSETRTPASNTNAETAEELYGDTTPTTRR